jgi:hypothetical protein
MKGRTVDTNQNQYQDVRTRHSRNNQQLKKWRDQDITNMNS